MSLKRIFQSFCLLVSLLLAACTLPPVDANPPDPEAARRFVEAELKRDWQQRYAAHLEGRSISQRFLAQFELDPTDGAAASLPVAVADAYAFYFSAVQQPDWGNVYLLRPEVQGRPFYLIYVTTDGDDGWIELYSLTGAALGTARRYLELVSWGEQPILRQQTATGDYPADLRTRFDQTLWGK